MVRGKHHIRRSGDNNNHAHTCSHPHPLRSDTLQSHKDHDTTQWSMGGSTGSIKALAPCLPLLTYTSRTTSVNTHLRVGEYLTDRGFAQHPSKSIYQDTPPDISGLVCKWLLGSWAIGGEGPSMV